MTQANTSRSATFQDRMLNNLLTTYDNQLRTEAEIAGAVSWDRAGPLWRAKFPPDGFVTYRDLCGLDGAALSALIAETVAYFAADPAIEAFEWKTRGHDLPPDLGTRLIEAGLVAEEPETVMVGEAAVAARPVEPPSGVQILRVDELPEARSWLERAADLQHVVCGAGMTGAQFAARVQRQRGLIEIWVAHMGGVVLSTGRLEQVASGDFAGLWGGATLPQSRGLGIYRALTAARAQSALRRGQRYLHSDCTAMSRPILERAGLVAITTTTPYIWNRTHAEN